MHYDENRNNTYIIDRSVSKIKLILLQHQFYNFQKSDSTLVIKGSISSLTISGNNNKITFKKEILNLIINGSHNKINATHRHCVLSNVVFNGNSNKIEVGLNSQNVCNIQNGRNNVIYCNDNNRNVRINNSNRSNNNNMFNFGGSNISINFNGDNSSNQMSKYMFILILIQVNKIL